MYSYIASPPVLIPSPLPANARLHQSAAGLWTQPPAPSTASFGLGISAPLPSRESLPPWSWKCPPLRSAPESSWAGFVAFPLTLFCAVRKEAFYPQPGHASAP